MRVQDVLDWIDGIAPFATQEGFDNAGLLIGDPEREVRRVLFCLDATQDVVKEAADMGAELIVAHHPLMFGGVKQIRSDEPEGATLAALIRANVCLIAAHTNFDQAVGGTGDSLAKALALDGVRACGDSRYLKRGSLSQPMSASALLAKVNGALASHAQLYGDPNAMISCVAVGPGAIGEEYAFAAHSGAQAFVVGEIKHHQIIAACAMGLCVYETGHYATELPGITALYERFESEARSGHWSVQAHLTTIAPYRCFGG